ncbi:MAG: exosortase C-terminal domain/associated protein EpsI [Armatimonadota bacterium]
MDKLTQKKYFLLNILFLITAVISYWISSRPIKVLHIADMHSLDKQIGNWQGKDVDLPIEISDALNADELLSRQYDDWNLSSNIYLLVVYRNYGRRDFAHRPEMCYPAAGWEILSRSYERVPFAGKDVQAVKVVAQKDGQRDVILYWFASGHRTEANFIKQQVWMALDRLKTQKFGWAFIRLNSPVYFSEEETLEQMKDFMRLAGEPMIKSLTKPKSDKQASRKQ